MRHLRPASHLVPLDDKVLVIQLVLLGDVLLGELGQLDHLGDHLLRVVAVGEVHQGGHHAVHHRVVTSLPGGRGGGGQRLLLQSGSGWAGRIGTQQWLGNIPQGRHKPTTSR